RGAAARTAFAGANPVGRGRSRSLRRSFDPRSGIRSASRFSGEPGRISRAACRLRAGSRKFPRQRGAERMNIQFRNQTADLQDAAEHWTPQRILTWAFETFGSGAAISSAFGAEGMVLIDMASRLRKDF